MTERMMKIAIRADGSNSIGLGHITNSLAVAEALRGKGIEVVFVTKNFPAAVGKIEEAGYKVFLLPVESGDNSEELDFKITLEILKKESISLLVTDLLEIQKDYSSLFRKAGIKLVSIDILGNIALQSDIIINRTTIKSRFSKYKPMEGTKYYLGPNFVTLSKQFLGQEKLLRAISAKVNKVLICFGGGDEFNLTARMAKIFSSFPGISLTLILGRAFKGEAELNEIISKFEISKLGNKPVVLKDVKNMVDLFLLHDLAVCAGGSILYELAITGTPALILPMNDHQVENAQEFEIFGSVKNLGLYTEVNDEEIREKVEELLGDRALRQRMSLAGKRITEGKGAERAAKIIYEFLVQ